PIEPVPVPVVEPTVPPPEPSVDTPPATLDVALPQSKAQDVPSAAELARAAERSMAAGRRDETIRLLTQLVRRYPKSSPARAALFDLGRLLRASGRTDEARCAYRMLRSKWPRDAMRGEIDRVLVSLGEGPACRGLQPLP
ncbi:MAG TPA: tetratricopeptide repeat protein, partial [Nannocystaceae bacterium]|nr:tetratricopeptide repeat protein [Nannocystaceae bacterium]